jgi:ATP-dependent DNA helicase RecG
MASVRGIGVAVITSTCGTSFDFSHNLALCATNDGFRIAEKDLEIRGPGDIEGTRQSGALNFKLANILTDRHLLDKARMATESLLDEDPDLELPGQAMLKKYLQAGQGKNPWSKIS